MNMNFNFSLFQSTQDVPLGQRFLHFWTTLKYQYCLILYRQQTAIWMTRVWGGGGKFIFLHLTPIEPQLLGRPARPGHYTDSAIPALCAVWTSVKTSLLQTVIYMFNNLRKRFLTEDGEVLALIVQVMEADQNPHHIQLGSHGGKH